MSRRFALLFPLGVLCSLLALAASGHPVPPRVLLGASLVGALGRQTHRTSLRRAFAASFLVASVVAVRLQAPMPPPTGAQASCTGTVRFDAGSGAPSRSIVLAHARCRAGYGTWTGRLRVDLPVAVHREVRGAVVTVRGHLAATGPPRNPGAYDRRLRDRLSGIPASLEAAGRPTVRVLPRPGRDQAVRRSAVTTVGRDDPHGLVRSLVVGDRSRLDPGLRRWFARAGLAHVLALSGFHLGLVAGALFLVAASAASRLPPPLRAPTLAVSTAGMLAVFVWTVGNGPSLARASLMAGAVLLLIGTGRADRRIGLLLAVAAFVLLVVTPTHLAGAGFQLSCVAVLAIASAVERRSVGLVRTGGWIVVLTAPVVAVHFGVVPFVGILLTPAALPLVAVVLAAGLCALVPFAPASLPALAAGASEVLAALAGLGAIVPPVAASRAAGAVAALCLLAAWPLRPLAARVSAAGVLLVVVHVGMAAVAHPPLRVAALDVGQGDAILLRSPSGRSLLVDSGPPAAGRAVVDALRAYGVSRLDLVVITHPHDDHDGALPRIGREIAIGRVVRTARAGTTLPFDPEVRVRVLAGGAGAGNEGSLVLSVRHGAVTILLTGDAEAAAEYDLVRWFPDYLGADLVKVAHHGSRTSSTAAFIDRVLRPGTIAVISVGRDNRFGLPDEEVMDRWRRRARVLTTAREGALLFRSDGLRLRRD